jgi:hypothetical protein
MTNLVDLDRALAEFLEDGPNTAPEAPVIAALAHARTTPRRPDPLAWLRADAMAAPTRRILGLRPGLVLAAIALVVASVGVAVVGSRQPHEVVSPLPSATIAPTPTPIRSVKPSPTIEARHPFRSVIPLQVAAGDPLELTVVDFAGDVVDATSGTPGDGGSVPDGSVDIQADASGKVLVVTWTGSPCQTSASMSVDRAAASIVLVQEHCDGDEIPADRVVRLTFASPVDVSPWTIATMSVDAAASDVSSADGSAALPHSPFTRVTTAPYRSHICASRSPK